MEEQRRPRTRPLRVYVDTSVIGGCLDEEFAASSRGILEWAKRGRLTLLLSAIVTRELAPAPAEVLSLLQELPPTAVQDVPITDEIMALRDAYVEAGVVERRWLDDAGHVAAATVARADAMVSWNFRHVVRLDKIKAYNQVNLLHGYGLLTIVTPKEVEFDE